MKALLRRLAKAWANLCAVVLLAVVGLVAVEGAVRFASAPDGTGPRATADAFRDQPGAEATLGVVYDGHIRTTFAPYVHYRLTPHPGPHITIDEDGRRVVPEVPTSTSAPVVWMFGGSTLWGMGASDAHTIPAALQRALPRARIESFAQVGYTSTQGVIALLRALQAGRRPDVVVFYDGVNEVLPALKLGEVGVPLDVPRRRQEFNLTRPDQVRRLLTASAVGLARQSKLVKRLLPPKEAPPPVEDVEAMAGRIVEAYAANVRAVQGLADRFGFRARFYWQPTVFTKAAPSGDEQTYARRRADFAPLYAATRVGVQARLPEVTDLSDVFGADPAPVYFDFCHVAEAGNGRIAAAIAPGLRSALTEAR